jgi:hypothetical protein
VASPALIAGLAVAGGVGFLIYRARKAAATQKSCDEICKTAKDAYSYGGCMATCVASDLGVFGAIGSLFNTGRPNAQVLADDAKHNDDLNGPIKTKNTKLVTTTVTELDDKGFPVDGGVITDDQRSSGKSPRAASVPYGLGGHAIEYQNGCVPFWGAPGYEKCAPGTVDMFGAEHRLSGESVDMTEVWRYVATRAANPKPAKNTNKVVEQADYHAIRSGSFDPAAPDPTTQGPIANGDGSYTWLVAGEPLTCGANHAPALADATHFAYPPTCQPFENQGGLQGTGTQTAYDGDCQTMIAQGFTWNVDHWERLRVGQTSADAKCPPAGGGSSSPPNKSTFYPAINHGVL